MIGYLTLGTSKFDEAAGFYDELFASIGAGRLMEGDSLIGWSPGPSTGNFYASYFRDRDGNKLNAFCMTGD